MSERYPNPPNLIPPIRFTFGKPSRFRKMLWTFEAAVLCVVFYYFGLRPYQNFQKLIPKPSSAKVQQGPQVTALGDKARTLKGLKEVSPAFLAPLEGLAPGSVAAQKAQEITSQEYSLPIEVENSLGMRFRLIPPGTALIGSPESEPGRSLTEIQHVAPVPWPFYMGKCEVTQPQWVAITGSNPSSYKGTIQGVKDRPVEEVSWHDCQRFTLALCEKEGLPPGTYRMPTEAEWEYACRAGTTTAYCFGDDPSQLGAYADFKGNNDGMTNRVAQRRPNAYGVYDMHGNVWEWILETFAPYPGGAPIDPETAGWRSLRGGNWHEPAETCRSANRCRLPPASKGNILGFRLVRALPELTPPSPATTQPPTVAPDAVATPATATTPQTDTAPAAAATAPAPTAPATGTEAQPAAKPAETKP
ncbi:MAG: hypothetical protein A3K19_29055 [Lentisphaerae bacterium RIFOXYB12_FULL_65_16]|nr:MAG: hypothetical protein A3K18_04445 [Lentisphaerae bacterium RIFOXYA12_64_32]OGV88347.1 MAG: hypothetical protein A3K19_29055 [Lentisphaerae bacterium RIFOXYB12_FULL_65_16]